MQHFTAQKALCRSMCCLCSICYVFPFLYSHWLGLRTIHMGNLNIFHFYTHIGSNANATKKYFHYLIVVKRKKSFPIKLMNPYFFLKILLRYNNFFPDYLCNQLYVLCIYLRYILYSIYICIGNMKIHAIDNLFSFL